METNNNNIETKVLELLRKGATLSEVISYVRITTTLDVYKMEKRVYRGEQLMIDELAKKYFHESVDSLNGGEVTDVDKHYHYKFLEGENVVYKDLIEHCNEVINNYLDILKGLDK